MPGEGGGWGAGRGVLGSLSHRHTGAVAQPSCVSVWPGPGCLELSCTSSTPSGFRNFCPLVSAGLPGPQSLPLSPGGRRAPRVTGKCSVPGAEVQKRQPQGPARSCTQRQGPQLGGCVGPVQAKAEGFAGMQALSCGSLGCEGAWRTAESAAYRYRCASGTCNHLCFGFIVSPQGTLA